MKQGFPDSIVLPEDGGIGNIAGGWNLVEEVVVLARKKQQTKQQLWWTSSRGKLRESFFLNYLYLGILGILIATCE